LDQALDAELPRYTEAAAGTCTIDATQPGDADHLAAPPVSQSFAVAAAATHLSAGPARKGLLGLFPTTFSATLTRVDDGAALGDRTVTFTVGSSPACSAPTNAAGVATCRAAIGPVDYLLATKYTASFAATPALTATTATGALTLL
jgi:hypothetical protein